ncbi:MAG TPA: hypothetical protein VK709_17040 [Candidatus Saccharimonadales bacterium]|jgi:hypothetical protein|nr:hypothetical protein [Candidatus Saccharimonadales bacterium]
MSKYSVALVFAVLAGLVLAPAGRAQTASPSAAGDQAKADKWNSIPPIKPSYAGKKSAPAPRRDISGIWDAAEQDGGRQPSGALEHPALTAPRGQGVEGGRPDETGIMRPLHYTPMGLEALKANKPSGPSVRQVPAALANDPVDQCDPIGFPRMELFELRTIELVQTANQVVYLNQFYGNWRVIWTDGRELPKDPDLRWNGYSVGKWEDDYTFVIETVGMNPRSWLDHAGRPHSEDLRVEERFHRVDHDNMELTVTVYDPKMYSEPWQGLKNFPLHLQPPDFDISELICSPVDMAEYNKQVGDAVLAPSDKKK